MSNRLDQDREMELQPKRISTAIENLESMGYTVTHDETAVYFEHNGNRIIFFPYSGWHTGKGIVQGRGWGRLKRQLIPSKL